MDNLKRLQLAIAAFLAMSIGLQNAAQAEIVLRAANSKLWMLGLPVGNHTIYQTDFKSPVPFAAQKIYQGKACRHLKIPARPNTLKIWVTPNGYAPYEIDVPSLPTGSPINYCDDFGTADSNASNGAAVWKSGNFVYMVGSEARANQDDAFYTVGYRFQRERKVTVNECGIASFKPSGDLIYNGTTYQAGSAINSGADRPLCRKVGTQNRLFVPISWLTSNSGGSGSGGSGDGGSGGSGGSGDGGSGSGGS